MLSAAPARRRGRPVWVRVGAALTLALGGLVGASGTAHADVGPCDNSYVCVVVGHGGKPPTGGGGSGGGGGQGGACWYGPTPMACYVPGIGWLSAQDGCYYMQMTPQPPAGDPLWQGHQPGDGAVYVRTCSLDAGGGTVTLWMAAPPPMPPQVTPGELAAWAIAKIPRRAAVIHSAPSDGQHGLVNSPVMLWIGEQGDGYDNTYIPPSAPDWATASVPGLSVTAYVWSTGVTWNTGEGQTVCHGPGTAFSSKTGFVAGCSYTYDKANDGYVITAVVGWHVRWKASTGAKGNFGLDDMQSANQIDLAVKEIQVLN
ncbi:hypothetical protein [Streptacidiphilus melanogenes]|uniref:hypothetical protein n=1 Tax=Streptacidiphilus melanogenes TaxID=411235 RepID=UPI0006944F8D|nr:hypothetical protein [Streptacidiphilus melanogenes]